MSQLSRCNAWREWEERVSAGRVKGPSLLTDFYHTCTACTGRERSARCALSFNPLQCEGRYGRKTAWASSVKRPLLLTDIDKILSDCRARVVSAWCAVSVNPLRCVAR
jgi:hypothetical protein